MIVTAHQPSYLPWAGYFNKISQSQVYVFLDHVLPSKGDWVNRVKIKTNYGAKYLTVPIIKKNFLKSRISELLIDNEKDWKSKHLNLIYSNYNKSKYFINYFNKLEKIYSHKWKYIADLNFRLLSFFLEELSIKVEILKSSEMNLIKKKSDLIVEICKKTSATKFIFGEMGINYADEESFRENNIKIYFQKFLPIQYNQLYGSFLPNLSIIDLLFNCGDDSRKIVKASFDY
jgi:hypothetical protein